jgi:flavodoxin
MKAMVVYDSGFGNTEQIAQAIGKALGSQEEVETVHVSAVKPGQLTGLGLLIVGSPTQKFRPTGAITNFLKGVPKNSLKGVKVAAFDTRFTLSVIEKTPILLFFVRIFGYAAKPIADRLVSKGGKLVIEPEGFFVEGMEGPLLGGELERSVEWAKEIIAFL